jgi:hypothetical protein
MEAIKEREKQAHVRAYVPSAERDDRVRAHRRCTCAADLSAREVRRPRARAMRSEACYEVGWGPAKGQDQTPAYRSYVRHRASVLEPWCRVATTGPSGLAAPS